MRKVHIRPCLLVPARETNAKIFEEDRVVLEAQQQPIDAMPNTPLRTLAIDAGSYRARRIIERMIGEEA
jgi:hypothetical protein